MSFLMSQQLSFTLGQVCKNPLVKVVSPKEERKTPSLLKFQIFIVDKGWSQGKVRKGNSGGLSLEAEGKLFEAQETALS